MDFVNQNLFFRENMVQFKLYDIDVTEKAFVAE